MTALEIKTELKRMINEETDITVLQAIKTILQKTRFDPTLKKKLTSRAQQSEKDIHEGRLVSLKEVVKRTDKVSRK